MLLEGEHDELCFAGDKLDVVFRLLLGLEPDPPDIDDSMNGKHAIIATDGKSHHTTRYALPLSCTEPEGADPAPR